MAISLDEEWEQYMSGSVAAMENTTAADPPAAAPAAQLGPRPPKCEELLISTKTKVLFLKEGVDIEHMFWNLPTIEYWEPRTGVIKKTIKLISLSPEALAANKAKIAALPTEYTEDVIKQINVEAGGPRPPRFKDERKITVGICKKDIMTCRSKQKNVFYNCLAMVMRVMYLGDFKEIHAKVFNTGKMEIPGVYNDELLAIAKEMVVTVLGPYAPRTMEYHDKAQTVLINSNFSCGFYIHRERLHRILSDKYKLDSSYDPCTYPGVKCKFYYLNDGGEGQTGRILEEDYKLKLKNILSEKKYTVVSLMIFRTGSSLIGGNCSDEILQHIFGFISQLLHDEYENICIAGETPVVREKVAKLRRKNIYVTSASPAPSK